MNIVEHCGSNILENFGNCVGKWKKMREEGKKKGKKEGGREEGKKGEGRKTSHPRIAHSQRYPMPFWE